MKLLGMLLSLLLAGNPHPSVIMVDTNLEKPAGKTDDFGVEHYTKKKFPVYITDINAVTEAAEKAAKMIAHQTDFSFDTIAANHSLIVLNTVINYNHKAVTVRVVTALEEKGISFDFELVRKEENPRKAQKKLLDFADYLSK